MALAVFLSDRICFGTVCDVAKASTAISAVNWVAWAGTFGWGCVKMIRGGGLGFARKDAGVGEPKVEMHQGV